MAAWAVQPAKALPRLSFIKQCQAFSARPGRGIPRSSFSFRLAASNLQFLAEAAFFPHLSTRTPTALSNRNRTTVTVSTILAHLETSEELVATGTYASVLLDKRAVVPSFLPIEFQDAVSHSHPCPPEGPADRR